AEGDRKLLTRLARSASLWERRIAIVATLHFIRRGDFKDTLRLAGVLLGDREDLLHKAAGWMLREVGKRDQAVPGAFLAGQERKDAADDAAVRHRAASRAEASAVPQGRGPGSRQRGSGKGRLRSSRMADPHARGTVPIFATLTFLTIWVLAFLTIRGRSVRGR